MNVSRWVYVHTAVVSTPRDHTAVFVSLDINKFPHNQAVLVCLYAIYSYVHFTVGGSGIVVSTLASINVVNRYWARLVLGWVTVCWWVNHLGV